MRQQAKADLLLQLFHRECISAPAVEPETIDPKFRASDEYEQWRRGKADIMDNEVLESPWIKTCTEGYITELIFYSDGTLDEYKLFDRLHTTGQWKLEDGLLIVRIIKGENQYEFTVIGQSENSLYSAIEYKNGELHSYLKLVPTRPK
ncbi:hypothetical protein AB6E04_08090 [Vibrio amylolyticus]|uniref:hypothetical protein n=1 Tax=Vibrio amylolyticus TaxID=2847292 RepID=UPI00354F06FC